MTPRDAGAGSLFYGSAADLGQLVDQSFGLGEKHGLTFGSTEVGARNGR